MIIFVLVNQTDLFSQTQTANKFYSHKVEVVEVLQTKSYTYLNVKERIKEKDSLQWLALPKFEPKVGEVYYFEKGLQMGEFPSKELNRTFSEIIFLGGLSTSAEVSDKNIVPAPPTPAEDSLENNSAPAEIHTVVVKEVLQTSGYTYLRVKEGEKEHWLAITKLSAEIGQTYTYDDAAMMTNFTSKELKRTFDEILFVAKLKSGNGVDLKENEMPQSHGLNFNDISEGKKSGEKKEIKIESKKGITTIGKILEKKVSFEGKKVKVRGEVTKFSSDILSKNWIHIEDGSSFSGKSDFVITTDQTVKVGDVITVEGIISTDRDFGSGYFFEVIMEEAKVK